MGIFDASKAPTAKEQLPAEHPAVLGVLEWSATTAVGHQGLDLDDEDLWASCIPTLGLPGGEARERRKRVVVIVGRRIRRAARDAWRAKLIEVFGRLLDDNRPPD